MDRREFFHNMMFSPILDGILKDRKDTKTLDLQILMIKALWELCKKANYGMFLRLPRGYFDETQQDWIPITKIQVFFVGEKGATLQIVEDFESVDFEYDFIKGNFLDFSKLPEVINFYGVMFPIFECFRLEVPKFN